MLLRLRSILSSSSFSIVYCFWVPHSSVRHTIKDEEMKYSEKFLELAGKGKQMDVMRALYLLTDAYIDMCGVSLGARTVYYLAGEGWQHKLALSNHELSNDAKHEPLVCLFPLINKNYNPELYDKYDISPIDDSECINYAETLLRQNGRNEELVQALCAGIWYAYEETDDELNIDWITSEIHDEYELCIYNVGKSESISVEMYLFKNGTPKIDFHFVIDFTWFLATDELRLLQQVDRERNLNVSGKECKWDDYGELQKTLITHFSSPVNKQFMPVLDFENELHYLISQYDEYAKSENSKTLFERLRELGLSPQDKYKKFLCPE